MCIGDHGSSWPEVALISGSDGCLHVTSTSVSEEASSSQAVEILQLPKPDRETCYASRAPAREAPAVTPLLVYA